MNAINTYRTLLVLLVSTLLGAGCGEDRPDYFESAFELLGPFAADGRFVYVNQTVDELLVITPDFEGRDLAYGLARVDVGADPFNIQLSSDGSLLFSMNAGDQTLSIVRMSDLQEERFELPSDYDALTISPSGRFVVAHYADASAGGAGNSVFRNQNEITIFDLNPEAEEGGEPLDQVDVRVLSLRSSPLGFDFAPPFSVDGKTHYMLVVRSVSALAMIDMTAEDEINEQRRLFFVPQESTERLVPTRVLFSEDDPGDDFDMKMWVLTTNAQDIFEVSILPPDAEDETELALSINQFPAGRSPVEMVSYVDRRGEPKLLILNGRRLVVVDVATGNSTDIDVNWQLNSALTYQLVDDESGELSAGALLYQPGEPTVVFADLESLEDRGTRALTPLALSRSVQSIQMLPAVGNDKAIVIHSGETALSVLNLARRFDIPLPGSATLANTAFSAAGDRLFTTVSEVPVLATIELQNGHPSQIDIPEPGGAIAVMSDPQVILVDHLADEGRITLLNGVEPALETGITLDGLFLDNIFTLAASGRGGE